MLGNKRINSYENLNNTIYTRQKIKEIGKAPALTTFAVWNLMCNNEFDSTKAKTELEYTTRPYQDTIHDQVEWMKSAGLI